VRPAVTGSPCGPGVLRDVRACTRPFTL